MKNTVCNILMLMICILFQRALTEMVPDDSCDIEDEAMTQWYSHVFQFVTTNQNATQNISELKANLRILEAKVEKTHTKLAHLEVRVEETYKKLEGQHQTLQTMHDQMQQLQQRTNGDIVIQRRMDGSVDFFRSWADYKLGFGNKSGEFFIGLEQLHKLTNSRPYQLLVVLEDWENDRRYALYDQFIVGSEAEKYVLKQLGTYSGSAGDSMRYELGQKFSTRDRDNDSGGEHCAVRFTGAWWYNSCHRSNPNGRYLKGKITADERAQGVHWEPFNGHLYSLKFVEMTIRPH